ncbi:helix-turn-helix transcriptional regulator [Amphibacillus sp. Q70]|uniref:helix-turn-helix transcriptional regulator n=1 Tax=Amphibacillus sp. Q70 TaxID=3453416 RepID=UPI003F85372F
MHLDAVIHQTIEYIEMNLHENLTLDDMATRFNYSKYYFHKAFKIETGFNLYDYIRRRRLVNASKLLIYSDLKIIDIAFLYQFGSHEAFSRSFQRLYNQSPSQYRIMMKNTIKLEEEIRMDSLIKGWTFTGTDLDKYTLQRDNTVSNLSESSIKIASIQSDIDPSTDFSNFMQTFKAKSFIGKRMKFSAFIKSEDVAGWSGLWMRIDDFSYNMLGFDNMSDRPIKGTTGWNQYACVLDVPKESENINIGLILAGSGSVWLDNCSFTEVDKSVPITDIREPDDEIPDKPVNIELI